MRGIIDSKLEGAIINPYTTTIRFKWDYPSPAELEQRIFNIGNYIGDFYKDLELIRRLAVSDMNRRFLNEEDLQGQPWHPWSDEYALVAEAENQGILRKTEALYMQAVNPSNYKITFDSVDMHTAALPHYWIFHDQPVGTGPFRLWPRPFIGLSDEARATVLVIASHAIDKAAAAINKHGAII